MSRSREETVVIEFESVLQETAHALLISVEDEEVWLQKSRVFNVDETNKTLQTSETYARVKGLV